MMTQKTPYETALRNKGLGEPEVSKNKRNVSLSFSQFQKKIFSEIITREFDDSETST